MLQTAEELQFCLLLTVLQKSGSFPACLSAICDGYFQVIKSDKAMGKITAAVVCLKQFNFSVSERVEY